MRPTSCSPRAKSGGARGAAGIGRTAILVGGLLVGVIGAVWLAVKVWRMTYAGERPAIDAMAPRIPADIIDSAIALGAVTPADTVQYVFAPAGKGMTDAFIVTTREMVAPVGGTTAALPHCPRLLHRPAPHP